MSSPDTTPVAPTIFSTSAASSLPLSAAPRSSPFTSSPSHSPSSSHDPPLLASDENWSRPEASSEQSLTHKIKKSLWQGDRTINSEDPKFDVVFNNFKNLGDTLFRLRLHLNEYVRHVRGLITTRTAIASDFVLGIFDDQNMKQLSMDGQEQLGELHRHEYAPILNEVRSTYAPANIERVSPLVQLLETQGIAPIDQALSSMIPINQDIDQRHAIRSDVDYYDKKLSGLRQDRVLNHTGASDDQQADQTKEFKLERNQCKYDEVSTRFNAFSAYLLARMLSFYNHRAAILGPALQAFLAVEHEIKMLAQKSVSEEKIQKPMRAQEAPDLMQMPFKVQEKEEMEAADESMMMKENSREPARSPNAFQ